ncbi:uncharacterized protein N7482_007962 [Penicillium canariense]|uniref:Myb-like domain-containing protein n=1 Tax=Penicillium canariense TaxID=189055 RepID=A0A9W9HXW1_9EURO|nr:uncharacterized protein N7482_007962 [Penicillium canariense]KAJ5160958.1 hypothetical protein N7482_007962 [Penicillium canariense]
MVTLNQQKFWQPTTGISRECSDNGPQHDSSRASGQSITHVERCEANGYVPWKSRPHDGNELGDFVSQNRQSAEETIHETSARDTPAADTNSDYPDYPEEVALYPSSRVSSSPSVTGLDGPGTSRVFDVFQDDPAEQECENVHERSSSKGKKRALERPDSPRKRPQTRYLNTADPELEPTRRRCSRRDERPFQDEESHSQKHSSIRDSIRYLKHFYGLASAEAQFSDDLVDGGVYRESLVVVQNAIKFLQHSYGIIATSNLLTTETENDISKTRRRYSATSKKWEAEDDHLLSELRDDQKLGWTSIFRYFPKRSPSAVRQRHSIIRSRMSDSPSSKENDPKSSRQPVKSSSDIRKSHRLSRRSEIGEKSSRIERQPRYLTRSRKGSPSTPNSAFIDPRLRNLGNA